MTSIDIVDERSGDHSGLRSVCQLFGVILWVVWFVPPLFGLAKRYEFVQAIEFCSFAFCVPMLLTVGAPWKFLRLASNQGYAVTGTGDRVSPQKVKLIDRLQLRRTIASSMNRVVVKGITFVVLELLWRVAPVVDFVVAHPWLSIVESLSLVCAGVSLYTEIVDSPPLRPGVTRPFRIGVSAAAMWAVWVVAYLDGMSRNSWYGVFHHVAGRGLSLAADQQLSAGAIWLLSAAVFIPIVFWNLGHWLQSEEDPDDELVKLVREDKRRGFFGSY